MKKTILKRVVLFVFGCLAVGIFINYVIVKNIFALQGFVYIAMIALSVLMCGLIMYLLTFLIIKSGKQKSAGYSFDVSVSDGGGEVSLEKLIDKVGEHLAKVKQLNDYIEDKAVSDELSEIERSMRKIQVQLKAKTVGFRAAERLEEFFDYYMPLTVKILNSYRRIETNELRGKNAEETKKQVSAALPLIKKAFEKELDYMFTDEMLDITTDIKVLEAMLAKDGLSDSDNSDNNNII